uniref:hypothetical protein n=1 Tax=Escherichia coli TaxID=562 RepID=UPI0013D3ACDA
LPIRYDLQATRLDLQSLQREWAEACGSNILLRGGRKKKVRMALKPYCPEGAEVPDEIGRDLVILSDIAGLLREIDELKSRFRGME